MRLATGVALAVLAAACGDRPSGSDRAAPPAGTVAIVTLPAPATGGGMPAGALPVTVDQTAAQVQIRLPGLDHPADELTAELEARQTGEVRRWMVDALPPEAGGTMAITVPIYAVGPGIHVLTVWAGDADLLQRYLFEVVER